MDDAAAAWRAIARPMPGVRARIAAHFGALVDPVADGGVAAGCAGVGCAAAVSSATPSGAGFGDCASRRSAMVPLCPGGCRVSGCGTGGSPIGIGRGADRDRPGVLTWAASE
ncbi:hypothetical protein MFAL_37490 [Mycolicibacterium fallax]|nr:hypothetical protein MFAL_37490 [Mycolicibacterium fallax]